MNALRFTALCSAILWTFVQTGAAGRPLLRPVPHAAPDDQLRPQAAKHGHAAFSEVRQRRIAGLRSAARTSPVQRFPADRLPAAALGRALKRSEAISILHPEPSATPHPRTRAEGGPDSAAEPQGQAPNNAATSLDATGDQQVQIVAAGPTTEAVKNICGPTATVCAVWWPTVIGNQNEFAKCMNERDRGSDLNFGESPNEFCAAEWEGDCDGMVTDGTTSDLCGMINGMGASWPAQYDFGNFVTWGDCDFFSVVDKHERKTVGLALKSAPPMEKPQSEYAKLPPQIKVCAGRLYLLSPG